MAGENSAQSAPVGSLNGAYTHSADQRQEAVVELKRSFERRFDCFNGYPGKRTAGISLIPSSVLSGAEGRVAKARAGSPAEPQQSASQAVFER